jgi:hypothetical protein
MTIQMHTITSASKRADIEASNNKWFVYADGPDAAGRARLHMYRSWTGQKAIELGLKVQPLSAGFAHITEVTYETDKRGSRAGSEVDAKETAIEVCRLVLNVDLDPESAVVYTRDELEDAMAAMTSPPGKVFRSGPGGRSIGGDSSNSRVEMAELAESIEEYESGPNLKLSSSVKQALEVD